ncbi:hemerythrin domain-containing protein [Frateuria sp. MAH-13]|uniref:Hemerythrin domain-containing protein n=1 Tax=Frateuria flava TaxID=2821489 RepID=A0ABS4DIZ8_9GAMM|nr:hemerythrin domain-containing protein [Frateuria flava]
MRLTDVLRDQHAQLRALLDELQRLGLAGSEGRERLHKARHAMLAHLHLEDNRLYPALQAHPSTAGLARRYAGEMQQLTPALLAFFDTYHEGDADPQAFSRSLAQLLAVLQQRIGREESRLYPAYEAHCEPIGPPPT